MEKNGIYLARIFSMSYFHLVYTIPVPILMIVILYIIIKNIGNQGFTDILISIIIVLMLIGAISYIVFVTYLIIIQNGSRDNIFFIQDFNNYKLEYIKYDQSSKEFLFIFKNKLNWIIPQAIISINVKKDLINYFVTLDNKIQNNQTFHTIEFKENKLLFLLSEYISNNPAILNSIRISWDNKNQFITVL